jgi:hypothetical protein
MLEKLYAFWSGRHLVDINQASFTSKNFHTTLAAAQLLFHYAILQKILTVIVFRGQENFSVVASIAFWYLNRSGLSTP